MAKSKIKLNMKSILAAARDANCTDAETIIKAFEYAASKGYTQGVISDSWMNKIRTGWKNFNSQAILTLMDRSQSYPGNIEAVPNDVLAIFGTTKRKTKKAPTASVKASTKASSAKKMNLRTLLHKCYESHIDDATIALDILQKMKDSGYEITAQDIDFAQGWKKFNKNAFRKMTENTFNGTNGFANRELLECNDFDTYLPIDKLDGTGKTLNVRTVVNRFYEKHCTDALKIAATLQDLEIAGYSGCELFNIPGLINKTEDEVKALLEDAHNGTGYFEGMEILDCPNF